VVHIAGNSVTAAPKDSVGQEWIASTPNTLLRGREALGSSHLDFQGFLILEVTAQTMYACTLKSMDKQTDEHLWVLGVSCGSVADLQHTC
jgi:hypothetical protein